MLNDSFQVILQQDDPENVFLNNRNDFLAIVKYYIATIIQFDGLIYNDPSYMNILWKNLLKLYMTVWTCLFLQAVDPAGLSDIRRAANLIRCGAASSIEEISEHLFFALRTRWSYFSLFFFLLIKKKIEDNTILINSIIKVFKFFSAIFAGFNKQFGRYYIRTEPFKALVQNLLYYREIV